MFNKKAFTLFELLVTVFLIGLVSSFFVLDSSDLNKKNKIKNEQSNIYNYLTNVINASFSQNENLTISLNADNEFTDCEKSKTIARQVSDGNTPPSYTTETLSKSCNCNNDFLIDYTAFTISCDTTTSSNFYSYEYTPNYKNLSVLFKESGAVDDGIFTIHNDRTLSDDLDIELLDSKGDNYLKLKVYKDTGLIEKQKFNKTTNLWESDSYDTDY